MLVFATIAHLPDDRFASLPPLLRGRLESMVHAMCRTGERSELMRGTLYHANPSPDPRPTLTPTPSLIPALTPDSNPTPASGPGLPPTPSPALTPYPTLPPTLPYLQP